MNSKIEVRRLLIDSGNKHLFTEDNYKIATLLTKRIEKTDNMLKEFFISLEGMREKYKHDLIVKNCKP